MVAAGVAVDPEGPPRLLRWKGIKDVECERISKGMIDSIAGAIKSAEETVRPGREFLGEKAYVLGNRKVEQWQYKRNENEPTIAICKHTSYRR